MIIDIKYCVQWDYKPVALRVRAQLLKTEKCEVTLTEGAGGIFEIKNSEQLVFSKKAQGRFPTEDEIQTIVEKS